jgi:divalent metal cation (Fe/Co/Zn/Cd) transporter
VDGRVDIMRSHDLIDNIELDIRKALKVNLVVHLDPVVLDDPFVNQMRKLLEDALAEIDSGLRFHDFRMVKGITHHNMIFDITIPFSYKMGAEELVGELSNAIRKKDPALRAVINVDRG